MRMNMVDFAFFKLSPPWPSQTRTNDINRTYWNLTTKFSPSRANWTTLGQVIPLKKKKGLNTKTLSMMRPASLTWPLSRNKAFSKVWLWKLSFTHLFIISQTCRTAGQVRQRSIRSGKCQKFTRPDVRHHILPLNTTILENSSCFEPLTVLTWAAPCWIWYGNSRALPNVLSIARYTQRDSSLCISSYKAPSCLTGCSDYFWKVIDLHLKTNSFCSAPYCISLREPPEYFSLLVEKQFVTDLLENSREFHRWFPVHVFVLL